MFNNEQQEHIKELSKIPKDKKCKCGWYLKGDCPHCIDDDEKNEKLRLLHPESPGMYITVNRNWLQKLFYPKDFATLGEAIKSYGN